MGPNDLVLEPAVGVTGFSYAKISTNWELLLRPENFKWTAMKYNNLSVTRIDNPLVRKVLFIKNTWGIPCKSFVINNFVILCLRLDSNQRPQSFQPCALPTELLKLLTLRRPVKQIRQFVFVVVSIILIDWYLLFNRYKNIYIISILEYL